MRTLILSLGMLACTGQAYTQFLKFGIKAGANMEKIQGVSFNDGYNLGYYAGIFTELKLGQKWYLQPEIFWGESNLTTSDEFKDIYENILDINRLSEMKLQRLSIPISLNYKIANIFSLGVGPQFSIITDRQKTLLKNAGDAFSDGDIGLMVGGNLMVSKFRFNARYIWGLRDMNNIDNKDPWKTQTAQIGVGFVF